jgi:membrane-bound metal-dependent hydrolase YbcI (DUF457 family)
MLLFGHLGIGLRLARPFGRLPLRWVLLGTLLPDLIDKPLYYGLSTFTGLRGAELGLISGTRTFGHTGLLILLVLGFSALMRSHPGRSGKTAALAVGMATHLLLDAVSERLGSTGTGLHTESASLLALVYPYFGRFAVLPFSGMREHFLAHLTGVTWITESVGAILLTWELWTRERSREILTDWRKRFRSARGRRHADPSQPRPR